MNNVYIMQDSPVITNSFNVIARFGCPRFIFSSGIYPDDGDDRPMEMQEMAMNNAKKFNPKTDYLLLTGDPISIFIMAQALTIQHYKSVINCLKWDRHRSEYYIVKVKL